MAPRDQKSDSGAPPTEPEQTQSTAQRSSAANRAAADSLVTRPLLEGRAAAHTAIPIPRDPQWFSTPAAGARVDHFLDVGDTRGALEICFDAIYVAGRAPESLLTERRAERIAAGIAQQASHHLDDRDMMGWVATITYHVGARLPVLLGMTESVTRAYAAAVGRMLDGGNLFHIVRAVGYDPSYGAAFKSDVLSERLIALVVQQRDTLLSTPAGRIALEQLSTLDILDDKHERELAHKVFGIEVSSGTTLDTLARNIGLHAGDGTVPPDAVRAVAGAAAVLPVAHMALLDQVKLRTIAPDKDMAGYYVHALDMIAFDPKSDGANTLVHELGHALDARLGYPSTREDVFGWRSLGDADALAKAADLDSLRAPAPALATAIRKAYHALFAGKRGWRTLLEIDAPGSVSQKEVDAFLKHPAYLAGAATDAPSEHEAPTEHAVTARDFVTFNAYYGKAWALPRSHYDFYAAANMHLALYAPGECFAETYVAWYASQSGKRPELPAPSTAYFQANVVPYKVEKKSARTT